MAAMEALSRSEYPGILATLQPAHAFQALSDRVKRITKINSEIADWLQERRKVEEQYINNLRKLLVLRAPNPASELGIFQAPWDKILQSTETIAASHRIFAQRIEQDIEGALRAFQNKREMQNMQTISANLHTMAKELEEAQDKSEKLTKKGAKANTQKVELAAEKLESATGQWESQAPFIFETLQALDEQRINHLRDVLTQFLTHEVDQASRTQASAEQALNTMLEINTAQEIENFASRTVAGKPKLERRRSLAGPRQSSVAPASSLAPVSMSGHEDDVSDTSGPREGQTESRIRSRIGTILGRRRQSLVGGGFGPISEKPKHLGPFTRSNASNHSRLSPRASSHNLDDSNSQKRLSSLIEDPPPADHGGAVPGSSENRSSREGMNGMSGHDEFKEAAASLPTRSMLFNGTPEDIFDGPPPAGPPPSHQRAEPTKDGEGFSIPVASHDPIAEAMKDAESAEHEQPFKLSIQKEPIAEEDQDAKQAALSNVANTLTQMSMSSRKSGTVRGRRDVRNTVYMPNLAAREMPATAMPPSPLVTASLTGSKSTTATLASQASHTSDTQSVRSGTSLGGSSIAGMARLKHPEMHGPGYGPGLHASIIEAVSASLEGGVVKSAKISGEVAFAYNFDPESSPPEHEMVRLNRFSSLSAIGPNRLFVSNDSTGPDKFRLNVSHLAVTTPAFTYRVHADDDATSLVSHCPMLISLAWKPQGDKLGLVVLININPASSLPRPVKLANVIIIATYEGARASGVQSKPSGTHLKERYMVYWRLGEVNLSETPSKIICRIIGEQNSEPQPGHIEVRWEYHADSSVTGGELLASGISVSRLAAGKGKGKEKEADEDDPFADASSAGEGKSWVDVPLTTRLVSGKYEARSSLIGHEVGCT